MTATTSSLRPPAHTHAQCAGASARRRRLTPADRDRLAREHMPLLERIARFRTLENEQLDDVRSDALLGLAEALDRYVPAKGIPFGAWASNQINWAIADGRRQRDHLTRGDRRKAGEYSAGNGGELEHGWQHAPVSLNQLTEAADGSTFDIRQLSTADETDELDQAERINDAIQQLPERERFIVVYHFFEDCPLCQIAEMLGVTESRVSQLLAKARLKLACALRDLDPVVVRFAT